MSRADPEDMELCNRVHIKSAGGLHNHFVLFTTYAPSKGTKKRIFSNSVQYGRSWGSKEDISSQDKLDFLKWIQTGLVRGGGSKDRRGQETRRVVPRSSSRLLNSSAVSSPLQGVSDLEVARAVRTCVNHLIHEVCRRAQWLQEPQSSPRALNHVPSKARPRHLKTSHVKPRHCSTSLEAFYRRCRGQIAKRRRAQKLTQRRSQNYAYRLERLKRASACRAEESVSWLREHQRRLATLIARQDLLKLLPEGDYSDAQLMRVNRQALVLHRYYQLLADAIAAHQTTGELYLVVNIGAEASQVLGEDSVAVSTVRYWHADYVDGNGLFRADERGYYARELLVMEEDVNRKFVKWSLVKAKSDDLSVEAAQDFLNNELLCSLEADTLKEYKIKLPVSRATTWRWMQSASIFRDKFKQCYYNDKHQDPLVVEDRGRYIQVMDKLMLRQPLWLQLSMPEYFLIKDRLPSEGLLVHHYETEGAQMVEVHVDLDDSFDAARAALPLGGRFSVRFPGRTPACSALRRPPLDLPAPGAGLEPAVSTEQLTTDTTEDGEDSRTNHPTGPQLQLPSVAQVNKMKVSELREALQALGLDVSGLKTDLRDRLLAAVQARMTSEGEADSGSDSDAEEYKVKAIKARRVVTHVVDLFSFDVVEYEVQWDWPDESNPSQDEVTWEKEGNLSNALEALHEFFVSQPKEPNCEFGHLKGVCRCALPLIHAGQDESIFKAYQKSSYQWVVQGVRGLRKKTDGPGEMVSGFKDEIRGFGHPLTRDELDLLNAFRKARGREPLSSSPAVRFLSYGKNKDGYWKYENFRDQVEDMLDMYEALYPNAQVLVEVDWSSGHSKHRDDALNTLAMSVNLGGKLSIPHASRMVDGCLGSASLLKVGDIQFFYFLSAEERAASGATDGMPDPPPFYKPHLSPEEYVGLAKGKKQILFERGLWKPGMVERIDDEDPKGRDKSMSIDHVLSSCPDFRNETSALQTLVELRGHILVMSPKGHCELAGNGIEYDWGRMKQNFRRKNKYTGFHSLILSSMAPQSLPLSTSRKFARKARAYRRAYREGVDNEHVCIEKMVQKFKAHRNAIDFATSFIRNA